LAAKKFNVSVGTIKNIIDDLDLRFFHKYKVCALDQDMRNLRVEKCKHLLNSRMGANFNDKYKKLVIFDFSGTKGADEPHNTKNDGKWGFTRNSFEKGELEHNQKKFKR